MRQSPSDLERYRQLAGAYVASERTRCVQCGICSYSCPIDIDVRAHARLGAPIVDRRCLTCGECVARCPRGTVWFAPLRAARGIRR
jgi:heterodisulfide reductase subunit C